MKRKFFVGVVLLLMGTVVAALSGEPAKNPRLKNAFRRAPVNGWTFVHLEGNPSEIGFQHGYLLASEILEMKEISALELNKDSKKPWTFFRNAARNMMWPRIEKEYREELQGIADGVKARGIKLDLWDIVAMNGLLEWGYY
jgi:hypothetical protein